MPEGAPLVPRLTSALQLVLGCAPKKAPPANGLFASVPLLPSQTPPGASEMGWVAFWVACFLPTGSKSSPESLRSFLGGCGPEFLGPEMHWCGSGSISSRGSEQLQIPSQRCVAGASSSQSSTEPSSTAGQPAAFPNSICCYCINYSNLMGNVNRKAPGGGADKGCGDACRG